VIPDKKEGKECSVEEIIFIMPLATEGEYPP
jgi:hypothetical protein